MAISNKKNIWGKPGKALATSGFTIIEMLIVVAIFAIVATVLLFNYSSFSTNVAVRDLAEEIGLTVRKAQSYATSVHSIAGTNGTMSDMFPAYGISFSVNNYIGQKYDASNTNFVLFADVSPGGNTITNDQYDNNGSCGSPANASECLENFGINNSDKIVSLCTDKSGCISNSGTVDVIFHRPSPDADICVEGTDCSVQKASYLYVTVQSPKGIQHVIKIWNTGQIGIN